VTDERSPAEVFARLSDATRVEILLVLDRSSNAPLQFSTLYDDTDCEDSARFNYHLQKLRPWFVRKREAGYALSAAGNRIVRAIRAGTYAETAALEPTSVESRCLSCGADHLRVAYEEGRIVLDCPDCDRDVLRVAFPASGVRERDPETLLDAFDRWSRLQVDHASAGVCPTCGGRVARSVEPDAPDAFDLGALAAYDCRVCGWSAHSSLGAVACRHPDVRACRRRHGDAPGDRYYWETPQYVTDEYTTVRSRDPWEIAVLFPFDDGDCRAVVDEDLTVAAFDPPAD
jgi:predicted RNA-binding Zn-ribbon protein involved in translation (DUF1610 family)